MPWSPDMINSELTTWKNNSSVMDLSSVISFLLPLKWGEERAEEEGNGLNSAEREGGSEGYIHELKYRMTFEKWRGGFYTVERRKRRILSLSASSIILVGVV